MRLVVETELRCQGAEVDLRIAFQGQGRLLEAEPAEHPLRPDTDLAPEPALQGPLRQRDRSGDLVDPDQSRVGGHQIHHRTHPGRHRGRSAALQLGAQSLQRTCRLGVRTESGVQGADRGAEQIPGRHHRVGQAGDVETGPGVEPVGSEPRPGHSSPSGEGDPEDTGDQAVHQRRGHRVTVPQRAGIAPLHGQVHRGKGDHGRLERTGVAPVPGDGPEVRDPGRQRLTGRVPVRGEGVGGGRPTHQASLRGDRHDPDASRRHRHPLLRLRDHPPNTADARVGAVTLVMQLRDGSEECVSGIDRE